MSNIFIFFIFLQVFTSTFIFFAVNPIYSLLLLILLFFESSIVLSLFNLEFMSIIFILIYVGAIAILFLFVIMLLKLKLNDLELLYILPNVLSLCVFTLIFIISYLQFNFFEINTKYYALDETFNEFFVFSQVLYNYSILCFLIAGLVLLIALLGSVVLSLDFNKNRSSVFSKNLSRISNFISFLN